MSQVESVGVLLKQAAPRTLFSEIYLNEGNVASLGLTAATSMQECAVKCSVSEWKSFEMGRVVNVTLDLC